MRKKPLLIVVVSLTSLTLISGVVFTSISKAGGKTTLGSEIAIPTPISSESDQQGADSDYTYIPPTLIDITATPEAAEPTVTEAPFVPATEMDLELGSITIFVNKEYALPKSYRPDDLVQANVYFKLDNYDERTLLRREPAEALEQMFEVAKEDGYILSGVSGFRSYERQKKIFTNNIAVKGKDHTLRYSAVPGTSEHQTGLAIDVSSESAGYKLSAAFGTTPEGRWLSKNAHHFGYIIRYPKNKYEVTGYAYEPWHIRYVGKALATYLYDNSLTLDEYYNYTPSKGFDFEALYADLINYIPPQVTLAPLEGDGMILGENGEIIDADDLEDLEGAEGSDIKEEDPEGSDSNEKDPENTDEKKPSKPPKKPNPNTGESDSEGSKDDENTSDDDKFEEVPSNNDTPIDDIEAELPEDKDGNEEIPDTVTPLPPTPIPPNPTTTITPQPSPSLPAPTPNP